MAFVPATNTAEVVVKGNWGAQDVASVHNFRFFEPLTVSLLETLADAVIQAWIDNLAANIVDAWNLISVKATDLTTNTSPSIENFAPAATNGDIAVLTTPLNCCLVISEGTQSRGRSFRGRSYQMGIPTTVMIDAGSVNSGYRDAVVADFVAFIDDIEAAVDAEHVVLSRQTGGADRLSGVMTVIDSYSANQDTDSQRRRLKGRGS